MSIPNQPSIEVPLLLELERSGGRVRKGVDFSAFYERVGKHFPDLTPEDKQLRRQGKGHQLVWPHSVEWARNRLRTSGEMNGKERGVWEITERGRQRLRTALRELGVSNAEGFIRTSRAIPDEVGARWRPAPLELRSRVSRPGREQVEGQPAPPQRPQESERPLTGAPGTAREAPQSMAAAVTHPVAEQLRERLSRLSPAQFERVVGEFLNAKGFSNVRITGRTGDDGIDGEGEVPFVRVKVAFQAKRYAPGNNVGIEPVQRLGGSMTNRFDRGIFITTSSFSQAASGWVEETHAPITLVNGSDLVTQMVDMGLGVRTIPVVEKQVDESFFERLGV